MDVIRAALKLGSGAHKAIALTSGERSHSYSQLLRSASEISSRLQKLHQQSQSPKEPDSSTNDLQKRLLNGARVGIVAAPCAEFLAGMWATWISGGIAVPLALSHPETELTHVLKDANIKLVLTTDDHRAPIETVSKNCSAHLCILSSIPSFELEVDSEKDPYDEVVEDVKSHIALSNEQEAGLIIYTSGTTGKPKGAVHTHAGMGAQVDVLCKAWEYTVDDCFLHCLPLHHVHGLFNALLAPLYAGATVSMMPKFSVRGVWEKWVESQKSTKPITCFTGVPTMYVRLLQGLEGIDQESRELNASAARRLRLMMCGSSALPFPVMTRWESITGHRLLERYGMTEFGMAFSNPLDGPRKAGTVGKPLPGVEFQIRSEENSEPGTGELCVKSPSMFKEYWKQPQVTKDSFGNDGYFMTGDIVALDSDGYLQILGRSSVDIIKSGGYKLSALEIESVLLEHSEISECAVMGVADKDYGELIVAIVIPTEGAEETMTLPRLREWASVRMAPYKVPQRLHIWKSLPRNAMGKVNKKELKNLLLSSTLTSIEIN